MAPAATTSSTAGETAGCVRDSRSGQRDHVHIGARAVLGAKAGVSNDVAEGVHMLGTPAVPLREQKLKFALMARLPEMREQLKQLQRQMDSLLDTKTDSDGRKEQAA